MNGRLPPRVPTEERDLVRAVELLAHFSRRGIEGTSSWARGQISQLCGTLPANKREAAAWKIGVRALRREVTAEPDAEAS